MSDPAVLTRQLRHQAKIYAEHRDEEYYALFWEPGLGKSKEIVDVASHQHQADKIDALLVIAPNSVAPNWALKEVPQHMATEKLIYRFRTGEKKDRDKLKRLLYLDPTQNIAAGRLRVVAMSYDSLLTEHGAEFARRLVTLYRTMIVADESTAIKNHHTRRSKIMKSLADKCHYRWILTGTPVAQGPFDVHSQIQFLDPDFWSRHGLKSFGSFKNEFGEYQLQRFGARAFNKVTGYRRLDQLQRILEPISSRLLKEDSEVELPPKIYSTRYFSLAPRQRTAYDELRKLFLAEIEGDPSAFVEAPMAITRATRLAQVCSGFVAAVPEDDVEQKIIDIIPPEENPRLQLLLEILAERNHKTIVWCRFRHSVDVVCRLLGDYAVRYDGSVKQHDREIALARFCDPDDQVRYLVANVAALSHGVTLNVAKTSVYYENSFSLEKRLQSEDRIHRIGQDQSVQIVDIVAEDTIDEHVVESLQSKFDVAAQVTGDRLREWIQIREDE